MISLVLLLGCSDPVPADLSASNRRPNPAQAVGVEAQAGEQHPPIPGDNPGWENVTPDFKGAPMAYGEERWDDVTMRIIGHYAQASRDLARLYAQQDRAADAKRVYEGLSKRLNQLPLGELGQSRAIRKLHIKSAKLHAAILAVQLSEEFEEPQDLGPNAQDRWHIANGRSAVNDAPRPWSELRIDNFEDFRDRHRLRLEMNQYWLDGVDPTDFSDPWGYWRPEAADATAEALRKEVSPLEILKASYPNQIRSGELGRLPTGDSYLDTAGGAGPMAIGKLAVLGLDDMEHRNRLEEWAENLNKLMTDNPDEFVNAIADYRKELEAFTHGSRFYNVKQLINTGTRHLARSGHYAQALQVFQSHRPLHAQDWLCPNRLGIQLGIEGRLSALAGDREGSERLLKEAMAEGEKWFGLIADAKTKGPRGPQGPPPPR